MFAIEDDSQWQLVNYQELAESSTLVWSDFRCSQQFGNSCYFTLLGHVDNHLRFLNYTTHFQSVFSFYNNFSESELSTEVVHLSTVTPNGEV
jgi:hypothetical protein